MPELANIVSTLGNLVLIAILIFLIAAVLLATVYLTIVVIVKLIDYIKHYKYIGD
jgi:hypothetical protein